MLAILLSLLFQSAFTVTLAWDANTETNIAGYHVYRAAVGSATVWTRLTDEPITETTYTDPTPTASHNYAVTAVDTDGNESDLSSVVRANSPPPRAPDAPRNTVVITITQGN